MISTLRSITASTKSEPLFSSMLEELGTEEHHEMLWAVLQGTGLTWKTGPGAYS